MQIRLMGTQEECRAAQRFYKQLESEGFVKSLQISNLYANRGSNTIFRVYINIEYLESHLKQVEVN